VVQLCPEHCGLQRSVSNHLEYGMEGETGTRMLYPIKIRSKDHPLVVVPRPSLLTPASHIERILKLCGRVEISEGFLEVLV